jgi:hypothetical protein
MSESGPAIQTDSAPPMTLWAFLWERRWFWLGPPLVALVMLVLLILAGGPCPPPCPP